MVLTRISLDNVWGTAELRTEPYIVECCPHCHTVEHLRGDFRKHIQCILRMVKVNTDPLFLSGSISLHIHVIAKIYMDVHLCALLVGLEALLSIRHYDGSIVSIAMPLDACTHN